MSPQRQPAPVGVDRLVLDRGVSAGDEWITVAPESIVPVLTYFRDQERFEALAFLTAVDHLNELHGAQPDPGGLPSTSEMLPPARFELVYQLRSLSTRRLLRIRVFPPGEFPSLATASGVYPNANWEEREVYDLFGIRFDGHPDLTRILMPEDWVGHPLRRDYPMGGEPVDFSDEQEVWHTAPAES